MRFLRDAAAFALTISLLTGCGSPSGSSSAGASPCPTPTPADDGSRLPRSIPLAEWGTIVKVEERAGFVGAEAVTDTLIVELYPEIVRTLTGRGFTLLGGDNEGFEAEISFEGDKQGYVNIILRQGSCEGEVRIRVLIEKQGPGGRP